MSRPSGIVEEDQVFLYRDVGIQTENCVHEELVSRSRKKSERADNVQDGRE